MAWNLGRILGLNEPTLWQATGDHVTVTGSYKAASISDGRIRREQILGYANNGDELTVALTIDGEPQLAGYYRVLGAGFTSDEFQRKQQNIYDFQVDLERMRGFTAPLLESTLIGALIPNNFAVVAATVWAWHGTPAAMLDYSTGVGGAGTFATRVAEDGTVNFQSLASGNFKTVTRGSLPAASFYQSAAQVQAGLLTTPYPVVGQQFAPAIDDWRLTNGLVRVQSSASHDGLRVSWYTGTAWGALKTFTLGFINATSLAEQPAIRIMRNAPEEVVVRVTFRAGTRNYGPVFLDVALRRGARVVRCYLTSASGGSGDSWTLGVGGTPAGTALTAGIKQTAADGDGNKIVLASSGLPNSGSFGGGGQVNIGSSTSSLVFDFGIGAEVSGAGTGNLAQDLVYQYLAGQAESQRVVVR